MVDVNLFPGEEISFESDQPSPGRKVSEKYANERYAQGSVRIVTEQARYPLSQIPSMAKSDDYILDPEFQRRHRWDSEKKSRLIESIIINVPIPPIFLYEVGYAKFEVMDGLQRMTAITEFYDGKFALEGLTEWPELNGFRHHELPDAIKRGIDRRYLSSIVLLQETAKDKREAQRLKQLVFERINSGGVKLSDQESRNAIYDGPMNRACIALSRLPALCKTWGIPEPDEEELVLGTPRPEVRENQNYMKMDDVELVLRFFAYRQRIKNQDGALKPFLDAYLQKSNLFRGSVIDHLSSLFRETITLAYEIFGESAFYLYRERTTGWSWYKRPTTAIYDPMMFCLSQNIEFSKAFVALKDDISNALVGFYTENYADFQGRYTNRENLRRRNKLFMDFFEEFKN